MESRQMIFFLTAALVLSCGHGTSKQQHEGSTVLSLNDAAPSGSADTARKNIIQENLFDDNDYLHGFVSDQSCCEYSVQQVNGAARFEVRKTDPDVSRSKRSEVTGKSYTNEERWYGIRIRLEDWIMDGAGEEVIQWHPNNHTGSSNVAIWASSGIYMLVISPHGDDNIYYELDSIQPNVPADFVFHIKWSASNDGLVELWKDGQRITNSKNNRTLPYHGITSASGCYFKMGIYKFGWSYEPARSESTTDKRVVYIEEFREGNEKAGYTDVKPGK